MHAGERSFLLVAALLSAACTRLLGIDDEYVLENADLSEPTGGTTSVPDAEGPAGAFLMPTGGMSADGGAGSGGGSGGADGGASAGVGCPPTK